MLMVLQEDIQNLMFKCEKIMEANEIKYKRNKKEMKTLDKVIENYEVSEDNEIIFNEINNRYIDLAFNQSNLRDENKYLKTVIRKLKSLFVTENVIEEDANNIEIGQLE